MPTKPPYAGDVAVYPSEAYQKALMDWVVWHIWAWKDDYYNSDQPVNKVDDATYDLWWANLLSLEDKYPHLIVEDSPTKAVGSMPKIVKKLSLQELRDRKKNI